MTTRTIADRILELAQSETKRWGGSESSLTHVAFVLASHWQKEFAEIFGPKGRESVEYMLRTKMFRGDEAAVRALLANADDIQGVIKAVHEALEIPGGAPASDAPSAVASAPEADSTDHETWLVTQIEDRFVTYADKPTSDVLDELYVLIAALKVGGLEAAHERMKQKLIAVRKLEPGAGGAASKEPADPDELSERTSRFLHRVKPGGRGFRPAESRQIAAQLLRPRAPIVTVVGDKGIGRTALLAEVAAELVETDHPMPVWRISPATIIANPVASLKMALEDVKTAAVIVIDDLDEIADLGTQDPDRGLLEVISDARFHPHARIVLVVNARRLGRIGVLNQALDEWMVKVTLSGLAPSELVDIVTDLSETEVAQLGMALGEGVVAAALAPAEGTATSVHPGLAVERIDAAVGRALLEKSKVVGVEHLSKPDGTRSVETETKDLAEVLRARVRGQDDAIDTVATRLALTRAGLDLRPQRPNGVFLFAGPTGVGKTELATQIAVAEYGSPDALIRLDMSEYGEYEFGLTRLIGVGQGYVGSSEPDGWLTTRVTRTPRSVVLLDEIEKAHSSVWNTFLQVFDAGRLTDGCGVTASFSETIVIMTSNIGVREAAKHAIGFGTPENTRSGERQLAAIKDSMAPELINRLDDIVLFNALTPEAIVEIAGVELADTRTRLGAAGWQIDYDEAVPRWLAETGYDATYGARHLMRNIEREFLGLLAKADSRKLKVTVSDGALVARGVE